MNLSIFQWAMLAVCGGGLVLTNAGPAFSWLSSKLPTIVKAAPSGDGVPTRLEVLADLDGASRYFESIGCADGVTAIQTAVSHAFALHPQTGAKS